MRGHPDQILGRLIYYRRYDLGYSRRELGEMLGRDRKFVERIERRGQTISPVYLKPLSKVLDLPLEQILDPCSVSLPPVQMEMRFNKPDFE